MRIEDCRLGFIGFGHMAQIIFQGLDAARLISRSQVLFHRRDPSKARKNEQDFGITSTSLKNLVDHSNLLLLCVRPNQAPLVLEELRRESLSSKMMISIMAGVKIASLQVPHLQVARAMPNIASAVHQGMTLCSFDANCSLELRSCAHLLFSALGRVIDLPESQMDIGTALAGSSPAFVFELIEAMAQLAVKEGLSYEKALTISAQAFLGSSALILNGAHPSELLNRIATEGGTTQAGLDVLQKEHLVQRFQSVIIATAARSKELSC